MDNKNCFYLSGSRIMMIRDCKHIPRDSKPRFELDNEMVTLSDLLADPDLYVDLIPYMKNILSVYKIKKGKRKFVYIDELGIKCSDSYLSEVHFSFIPTKTCVKLICSIKHGIR